MVTGDLGATRSSRHSLPLGLADGRARDGAGCDVEVVIVEVGEGVGETDWNMCIGSASKNSCAIMKGVPVGSVLACEHMSR